MKRWSTALTATMREHGDELLSYAATLVGPGSEELLEDALVAAFGGLRPPESASEARDAVVRALRRGAVRRDDAGPGPGGRVAVGADATDTSSPRVPVETLSARERAVLALRFVDGLAVPAIAATCRLRESDVQGALLAAIEHLSAAGVRIDAREALEGGDLEGESAGIGASP